MAEPSDSSSPTDRAHPAALVGRDADLSTLTGLLEDVTESGAARAALLVGEAGIGKSTLMSHLQSAALSRGTLVLSGRAAEFERDLPYGAAIDALRSLDHHLDGSGAPELRHVLHRRVADLLAARASRQPVLLCVDDAHWADAATVDLLTALLDRPPDGPVLTVIAYRPNQAGSAISATFERAAAAPGVVRIDVAPLTVDDAALVLGGDHTAQQVEALHAACGGNPFFLNELARRAGDAPQVAGGARIGEDHAMSGLLASEIEPLPGPARQLLTAGAVVGDPFDLALARAVATPALTDDAARAALDDLMRSDLVRPTHHPHAWAFRHPLIRGTVYRAISPGERLAAHRRAATALRAAGATDLEVAHHVAEYAEVGDPDAIDLLTRAGNLAIARAPRSAAHWLETAWRLVPRERRAAPPHPELLHAASVALAVAGRDCRAIELVEDASTTLPVDDPRRPIFDLWFALIEATVGRRASARTRLLGLAATLRPEAGLERVGVAMALAQAHLWAGDHVDARLQAAAAMESASALGGGPPLAAAESIAAWIAYVTGDLAEARARQQSALARFDALDDATVSLFPLALSALARTSWGLDRVEEGARLARRGLVVTRSGTWPILVVHFLAIQAQCERARGAVAIARDAADQAAAAAALMERDETLYWAASLRATMLEPTTRVAEAAESGAAAVRCAQHAGFRELAALAGQLWGQALLALDRPTRAIEVVLATHGGDELHWLVAGRRAASYALLTAAEIQRGRPAAAADWARRARQNSHPEVLPLSVAHADAAQAQVMLAAGQPRESADLLAAAAARLTDAGLAFEAARLELLLGEALIASGQRDDAAATLRRAEAFFASCGADRLQADAVRLLRTQGRRVTRSGRTSHAGPPEPLTGRQREIAELAARGASNPEIARELFVSVKTVETHLSAVFVKLGISSRRDLSDALRLAVTAEA